MTIISVSEKVVLSAQSLHGVMAENRDRFGDSVDWYKGISFENTTSKEGTYLYQIAQEAPKAAGWRLANATETCLVLLDDASDNPPGVYLTSSKRHTTGHLPTTLEVLVLLSEGQLNIETSNSKPSNYNVWLQSQDRIPQPE